MTQTFPKKVKITQNRIGWSACKVHQWIENNGELWPPVISDANFFLRRVMIYEAPSTE